MTYPLIKHAGEARLPTEFGVFQLHAFETENKARPYAALVMGHVKDAARVLTRVHSACLTGDTFGSLKCDCGSQLKIAQKLIAKAGRGIIVYADDHEGRGKGLIAKVQAYALQDKGLNTIEADLAIGHEPEARDYAISAQVVKFFGVRSIRLMTNNPGKIEALHDHGIAIDGVAPLIVSANSENKLYLETKRTQMGHIGIGLS